MTSPPKEADFSSRRWFWRCLIIVGLMALILVALRPAISYRALEIGLDVGWIGPLAATFNLVPLVLTVPAGRWMDTGGHRSAAIVGSIVLVAATTGFIWANSLITLIMCSLVGGACSLVINSAAQAMIAMYSPANAYDSRFAMFSVAGSGGQVVGGGLVAVMPSTFIGGAAAIFVANALAAVLVVIFAAGLHRPPGAAGRNSERASKTVRPSTLAILRAPGVTPAIVASLTVLATVDLIGIYLPVLGVERGWSEAAVGALLTVRAIATVLARLVMGKLSQYLGTRRLFVLSVLASALVIGTVALPVPLIWTTAMLVVAGLMLGFGQPLSMSFVAHAAPAGSRGMAMSLRMSGNMIGLALLPVLVGPLVGLFGAGAVFLAAAMALGTVGGMLARTKPDDHRAVG
jgi:MFS family permease